MSGRWSFKVVEVKYVMFGSNQVELLQDALDKHGVQGWELVNVVQASSVDSFKLFFKKEM